MKSVVMIFSLLFSINNALTANTFVSLRQISDCAKYSCSRKTENVSILTLPNNRSNHSTIPKILHQSWKTNDIATHSHDAVECHKSNELYAPGIQSITCLFTVTNPLLFVSLFVKTFFIYFGPMQT